MIRFLIGTLAFLVSLPAFSIPPAPTYFRYVFPTGKALVWTPEQPGVRLEENGETLLSLPNAVQVFPSTEMAPGAMVRHGTTFVAGVYRAPVVLLELMQDSAEGPQPWIFAIDQEGKVARVAAASRLPLSLTEPYWKQIGYMEQRFFYVALVRHSENDSAPSLTEITLLRGDRLEEPVTWSIESTSRPEAMITAYGYLVVTREGVPIRLTDVFKDPDQERQWRRWLTRLTTNVEPLPEAPDHSLTKEILPLFSSGLGVTEANLDLETARVFIALGRPEEPMIPTLLRIATEPEPEAKPKVGTVKRPLMATRLLAAYAELDPRALAALDQLANHATAAQVRQEAATLAKSARKDLLSAEWREAIFGCERAFE